MMRHLHTALLLVLLSASGLRAQQVEQLSLYQVNPYVINPAYAGTSGDFEVALMNRNQWSGVEDAPRTFTLSLVAPFKDPHIAMGSYLFVDNAGPTRRTGFQTSFSYHVRFSDEVQLGLAASLGMLQFAIDGTRITLSEGGDPALYNTYNRQLLFDAKFGAYVYGSKYHIGVTLPQLLRNQVTLYESPDPSMNRLEDHYMVTGAYRFDFGDFGVEPSVLVKYVDPAPIKIDASVRAFYRDQFWLGGSWRSNDAVVAMVGYEWQEQLSVALAYDYTTSSLQGGAGNTAELVLGFRFH